MVVITRGGESYYLPKILKERWDRIHKGKLKKIDEDRVYVVDGRERTGKSVFALQQAAYIDPTIIEDMTRITYSSKETLDAIRKTNSNKGETKVIIWDEAFRGLSSKAALSRENKMVTQALMEMGQKNLVLFIVSPSYFLLDFYAAVLRSNCLFHIVKDKKSNRRYFRVFNYKQKAKLYQTGVRKGWGYNMATKYKDNFSNKYPGGKEFEKKYRDKKAMSIKREDDDERNDRRTIMAAHFVHLLKNNYNLTWKEQAKLLNSRGFAIDSTNIGRLAQKVPPHAQM